MTKKDYELIAKGIRYAYESSKLGAIIAKKRGESRELWDHAADIVALTAGCLVGTLKNADPKFNNDKFSAIWKSSRY